MKKEQTIVRLLDLVNRFLNGERLSTKEIEKIYDISIRSAQRYILYLKEAKFNIQKDKNKYFLDFGVDEEILEEFAKNLGLQSMQILNKIKENIFYSKLDIEQIDLYKFQIIEKAIKEKKFLKGKYKLNDKIIDVYIKPLKITNFEGYWYLNAISKDKYKTYHIKTFESLKVTNDSFEVKEDILKNLDKAVNIWFDPLKKPFFVELLADEEIVKYLQRVPLSKTQIIRKNPDNTYTIELQITHSKEIIRKLLMWIPNIVIISPKWLKEEFDGYIKKYVKKYL